MRQEQGSNDGRTVEARQSIRMPVKSNGKTITVSA
jgi:hypothetical protein